MVLALLSVVDLCKGSSDLVRGIQPAVVVISPVILLVSFVRSVFDLGSQAVAGTRRIPG